MPGFVEIAREAFAFLESQYHFSIKECVDDDDFGQVTYVNIRNGVAVKLLYEFSNAFVFVFIYRLIDGQICDNVLPISNESEINCIEFNDVLSGVQKMKPAYEYGDNSCYYDGQNGMREYVSEFATRLQKYGGKLLAGAFDEMKGVEQIIKHRAREMRKRRGK
ncbi:hypothetical protein [Schlesneria paludicola]|uniref:hypothetical protein n=1 Tax=Schlesneria paludicola TaxID=360056 RepID=UPI00029B02BD|nr:hypothetical protein [Schlesneria paludicola]